MFMKLLFQSTICKELVLLALFKRLPSYKTLGTKLN